MLLAMVCGVWGVLKVDKLNLICSIVLYVHLLSRCPDCGGEVFPGGGCWFCPGCGWSCCGE